MGLLVLSRRAREWVTITTPSGETIRVCVVDVDRGKVRLGFDAAKDVAIMRDELLPPEAAEPAR